MLVPVIFMVVMVVRAAHSLKAELVNGTAIITIEDFDKACERTRLMHHGVPKMMEGKTKISVEEVNSTDTRDTESLFRSTLETLCPYVGYFPVEEPSDPEEFKTKKDTTAMDLVDESITKTSISAVYFNISDTTDKIRDVLFNISTEIVLTSTESIIKLSSDSDELTSDTEFYSILRSTKSIGNTTDSHIEEGKIIADSTITTTTEITKMFTSIKDIESDMEMTETTLDDSYLKNFIYNSSVDETLTSEIEGSIIIQNMTESTNDSDIESTFTVSTRTAKKIIEEDIAATPTSKTTNEDVFKEEESESNITELGELPVHTTSSSDDSSSENARESAIGDYKEHDNDYLIVFEFNTEHTPAYFQHMSTTAGPTTTEIEDSIDDYFDIETVKVDLYEPSEDVGGVSVTNEDSVREDLYEPSEEVGGVSVTNEETSTDVQKNKREDRVKYKHDAIAVDERRPIIVIIFVSILLLLSLVWAANVLYRRHKGSYVLPLENDNNLELGENSNNNAPK